MNDATKKQIANPENVLKVFTHDTKCNGVFTIKSKETGKEFTYNIQRFESKRLQKYLTKVLVETGYLQWQTVGYYENGQVTMHNRVNTNLTAKAISYVMSRVQNNKDLNLVEVYHMGQCLKCGKALTDSESIRTGLGPICRTK
jgi:hypothetical protein